MLESRCNGANWNLNVDFEFTARATPQQNILAETSSLTTLNKEKAMMVHALVPYLLRCKIVQESVLTATKLD